MDEYGPLRDLERRRPADPFTYRVHGEVFAAPSPLHLDFEHVMFLLQQREIPLLPNMPIWAIDVLFGRWAAHYDMPSFPDAQRLAYVVNRYRDVLEHDLHVHAHVDLTDLWRARRWRFLLNLIDHLPRHTYYSEAVSNDPEHARMLAEAMAKRAEEADGESGPSGPPMHIWSPEVSALTDLTDAVRRVEYAIVATNSEKGKGPKPPEPLPRPVSMLDRERKRSEYARRKAKHDKLAARLLPHKRAQSAE